MITTLLSRHSDVSKPNKTARRRERVHQQAQRRLEGQTRVFNNQSQLRSRCTQRHNQRSHDTNTVIGQPQKRGQCENLTFTHPMVSRAAGVTVMCTCTQDVDGEASKGAISRLNRWRRHNALHSESVKERQLASGTDGYEEKCSFNPLTSHDESGRGSSSSRAGTSHGAPER